MFVYKKGTKDEVILQILKDIWSELRKAKLKHPNYPSDNLYRMAIINEEAGEATRAVLHILEGKGTKEELEKELIQTAAMCLKFLNALKEEKGD